MDNKTLCIKSTESSSGVYYEVPIDLPPLGVGGAGTVRKGFQINEKTGVRKEVAIKFLFDDLPESAIIRSEKEANIRIVHENLVEMIDFVKVADKTDDIYGKSRAHYHVVSELLHGVMLLDLIDGKIEEKEVSDNPKIKEFRDLMMYNRNAFAIKVVRGLLSGIMALHDNGFIHRDIDPSNIMITTDGKIKLIDLGVAKKIKDTTSTTSQNLTNNGQFIGKPAYASPELADGDLAHQNETTDIYAIGIVLYQMVTGYLPFEGPIYEVLQMQKTQKLPLSRVANKKIRKIIEKATEKKQSDRYQSAAMFRADLDALDDNESQPVSDWYGMQEYIPWAVAVISGLAFGILGEYLFEYLFIIK